MILGVVRDVVTSAARTTTGQSSAIECDRGERACVVLDVTAQSGTTPTLDVSVEWSADGTTWAVGDPADAFTQIAAATGTKAKSFTVKAPFYRLKWTIAGTTPSYTFSIRDFVVGT